MGRIAGTNGGTEAARAYSGRRARRKVHKKIMGDILTIYAMLTTLFGFLMLDKDLRCFSIGALICAYTGLSCGLLWHFDHLYIAIAVFLIFIVGIYIAASKYVQS
jgi:hypothetical protein